MRPGHGLVCLCGVGWVGMGGMGGWYFSFGGGVGLGWLVWSLDSRAREAAAFLLIDAGVFFCFDFLLVVLGVWTIFREICKSFFTFLNKISGCSTFAQLGSPWRTQTWPH